MSDNDSVSGVEVIGMVVISALMIWIVVLAMVHLTPPYNDSNRKLQDLEKQTIDLKDRTTKLESNRDSPTRPTSGLGSNPLTLSLKNGDLDELRNWVLELQRDEYKLQSSIRSVESSMRSVESSVSLLEARDQRRESAYDDLIKRVRENGRNIHRLQLDLPIESEDPLWNAIYQTSLHNRRMRQSRDTTLDGGRPSQTQDTSENEARADAAEDQTALRTESSWPPPPYCEDVEERE